MVRRVNRQTSVERRKANGERRAGTGWGNSPVQSPEKEKGAPCWGEWKTGEREKRGKMVKERTTRRERKENKVIEAAI